MSSLAPMRDRSLFLVLSSSARIVPEGGRNKDNPPIKMMSSLINVFSDDVGVIIESREKKIDLINFR